MQVESRVMNTDLTKQVRSVKKTNRKKNLNKLTDQRPCLLPDANILNTSNIGHDYKKRMSLDLGTLS